MDLVKAFESNIVLRKQLATVVSGQELFKKYLETIEILDTLRAPLGNFYTTMATAFSQTPHYYTSCDLISNILDVVNLDLKLVFLPSLKKEAILASLKQIELDLITPCLSYSEYIRNSQILTYINTLRNIEVYLLKLGVDKEFLRCISDTLFPLLTNYSAIITTNDDYEIDEDNKNLPKYSSEFFLDEFCLFIEGDIRFFILMASEVKYGIEMGKIIDKTNLFLYGGLIASNTINILPDSSIDITNTSVVASTPTITSPPPTVQSLWSGSVIPIDKLDPDIMRVSVYDKTRSGIVDDTKNITWDRISNKPIFTPLTFSGDYGDILNPPALSKVATTGAYADLINPPPELTDRYVKEHATLLFVDGTHSGITFTYNDNKINATVPIVSTSYTNHTPVPADVGGILAGTTFDNSSIRDILDALLYPYQPPTFILFAISQSNVEVGDTISGNRTFTWDTTASIGIKPNSISITNIDTNTILSSGIENNRTIILPIGSLHNILPHKTTWNIQATDTKEATLNKEVSVSWLWKIYYGESTTSILNETNVKSLRVSGLSSVIHTTYIFLGGAYKYICIPSSMGTLTTFVDNETKLNIPFNPAVSLSVFNTFGILTTYSVYRSLYMLGSSINITVS